MSLANATINELEMLSTQGKEGKIHIRNSN